MASNKVATCKCLKQYHDLYIVYVPDHMPSVSISDRTRTVRTVWVYTYTVRPYSYGLVAFVKHLQVNHAAYTCFSCFEEKEIFIHFTLNLHVRELIKLLVYFVKYCNAMVFFSLLKYFSINHFDFLS